MEKQKINGKVVTRWFSRGKARIPVFEDGTIGVPSKASDISRSEYHYEKNKIKTDTTYDKYVKERDKKDSDTKMDKIKKYKDRYLKSYNKEQERNDAIRSETYTGNTSDLKGKHIRNEYGKKYNNMNEVINDPNSKLNKYINEKAIKKAETTGDFSKMTRRQLAEYIVDKQIERGVVKQENRELQVSGRLKGIGSAKGMSKQDLVKGAESMKKAIEDFKKKKNK